MFFNLFNLESHLHTQKYLPILTFLIALCLVIGLSLPEAFKYLKIYRLGAMVAIICSPQPVGIVNNSSKFYNKSLHLLNRYSTLTLIIYLSNITSLTIIELFLLILKLQIVFKIK